MKKKVFVALAGAVVLFSSFTIAKDEIAGLVDKSLNQAVSENVITDSERQEIEKSGILSTAYESFFQTGGDVKQTVDAVANSLVEQGYFSSSDAAKQTARKTLDQARHDESLVQKVYNILGL